MLLWCWGMRKRAAKDGPGDSPSLTPTPLIDGTLIIMDLDNMEELVEELGLSEYRPNRLTGLLTRLVEDLVRKWRGVVVYGLDYDRGTEEAVIEVPLTRPEELASDLRRIAEEVRREGGSISIVAVSSPVTGRPARSRREAYSGYRRRALRILRKIKSSGGGRVYIAP